MTDKTHNVQRPSEKCRIGKNVALYEQVIKTTEQLNVETCQPYVTMGEVAVDGVREMYDALDGLGSDAPARLEPDLIEQLREHLAANNTLWHKTDTIHTLDMDVDRHCKRLAECRPQHTKTEVFLQLSARFNWRMNT